VNLDERIKDVLDVYATSPDNWETVVAEIKELLIDVAPMSSFQCFCVNGSETLRRLHRRIGCLQPLPDAPIVRMVRALNDQTSTTRPSTNYKREDAESMDINSMNIYKWHAVIEYANGHAERIWGYVKASSYETAMEMVPDLVRDHDMWANGCGLRSYYVDER
jgi:hypothetical protein